MYMNSIKETCKKQRKRIIQTISTLGLGMGLLVLSYIFLDFLSSHLWHQRGRGESGTGDCSKQDVSVQVCCK